MFQKKCFTLHFGQRAQVLIERLRRFGANAVARVALEGSGLRRLGSIEGLDDAKPAPFVLRVTKRDARGDPIRPTLEGGLRSVGARRFENLDERDLCGVVRE